MSRQFVSKFFVLLVALQVLNLGLFAQDFNSLKPANTLSDFDPVDSMVEYISEVVLGHTYAMPEQAGSHHKTSALHKHPSIKIVSVTSNVSEEHENVTITISYQPYKKDYFYAYAMEINPPPPKA
jgi:hypothetical protein